MPNQFAPDLAKAFGIFLVVLGHVLRGLMNAGVIEHSIYWNVLDSFIYLFHMPLFFFLSGLFFEEVLLRRGYNASIKNNVYALLIPMIAWSYIQSTIQYFASDSTNTRINLHDLLFAPFPPRQQFWFLWTLFVISALFGLVFQLKHRRLFLWILGSIFAGLNLIGYGDTNSNLPGSTIIRFAPYFVIGVLGGSGICSTLKIGNAVTFFLFTLSLIIFRLFENKSDLVRLLASTLCILSVYKIALNLSSSYLSTRLTLFFNILIFIGMNSMIIYLSHVIFSAAFRAILIRNGVLDVGTHLVGGVFFGLLLPLALIPASKRISRFSPLLINAIFPTRMNRIKPKIVEL
jgi:fucose 4-O-acetylase-like acetyltransferase